MSAEPDMMEEALRYAAHGWRVFPLHSIENGVCTCRRREACPRKTAGKHPRCRHGFTEATTDTVQIRTWWKRWRNANIGVATGEASGIDVLDIDPRNGGDDNLRELELKHGALPQTPLSLTGGGGQHYLFQHHPGVRKNSCGGLADGIDLKANGGYFVAPPSIHISGERYCWEGASLPEEIPVANFPTWVLRLIEEAVGHERVPGREERIPAGTRNNTLTSFAGSMRRRGMSQRAIEAALMEENQNRCDPPLEVREVRAIARSITRYPATNLHSAEAPREFIPPGYDSVLSALLDVVRFVSDTREFPVLLFHVERTLGYGKQTDRTSLSQIVHGVFSQTHNLWIRRGCGLSKGAVARANNALEQRGWLRKERKISARGGHEANTYEVNWPALNRYIAERKQEQLTPCIAERHAPLYRAETHITILNG